MLSCYQDYRIIKDNGRYTDIVRHVDDLYEALDIVKNLYRKDRENRYRIECWDNFYDDDEYIDCEFNSIQWDSDTIPPWENV